MCHMTDRNESFHDSFPFLDPIGNSHSSKRCWSVFGRGHLHSNQFMTQFHIFIAYLHLKWRWSTFSSSSKHIWQALTTIFSHSSDYLELGFFFEELSIQKPLPRAEPWTSICLLSYFCSPPLPITPHRKKRQRRTHFFTLSKSSYLPYCQEYGCPLKGLGET